VVQTVGKGDQTINFPAIADHTFGDPDFTVNATATSGLAVSFGAAGNCTVTGNTVHITGAGSCTITASQPGDDNFNPAPDVPRSFTINKANQTIAFGPLPDRVFGDPDFTVSASSSIGQPVSFTASGNCTITGNLVHLTSGGSCTITAHADGNANFNPADNPQSFAIAAGNGKLNQIITFNPLPDHHFGDSNFLVDAFSSSGLTVTFSASGNCTVTNRSVHLTAAGSCTITASQAGNSKYNPAPPVNRPFAVFKADQTVTLAYLPDVTFGAADFNAKASSTSGLAISFSAAGNCTVTGAKVHLTAPGSCTITASQPGNGNFNPAADVSQQFTIRKKPQTISFGALAHKTFGAPDFTVKATASSGLPVSFSAEGNCTLNGATVHITGAGICFITALQPGNDIFAAAPSVEQNFTIGQAVQTIKFGLLPIKTFGDPDFTVSATSSSGLAVTFSASGNCTVTDNLVHLTSAGTCVITASQGGDANYLPADDIGRSFQIQEGAAAPPAGD
jgi:hypothetical protein